MCEVHPYFYQRLLLLTRLCSILCVHWAQVNKTKSLCTASCWSDQQGTGVLPKEGHSKKSVTEYSALALPGKLFSSLASCSSRLLLYHVSQRKVSHHGPCYLVHLEGVYTTKHWENLQKDKPETTIGKNGEMGSLYTLAPHFSILPPIFQCLFVLSFEAYFYLKISRFSRNYTDIFKVALACSQISSLLLMFCMDVEQEQSQKKNQYKSKPCDLASPDIYALISVCWAMCVWL